MNPLRGVRMLFQAGPDLVRVVSDLGPQIDELKILTADVLIRDLRLRGSLPRLRDAEFKVFSQFGDDGIIQHLISQVTPLKDTFIEFGVETYRESNTRFLLLHDNWRGLILDGSKRNMDRIKREPLYWRHDLTATAAFASRENVNDLFSSHGFKGEIGLLSIDIDGNDYWVWEAIRSVEPAIVIVEYNSLLGAHRALTIPYDPGFRRDRAHPSFQYWGASLKALCLLGCRKGFAFVGSNSAGNNAYFVRRDRLGSLRELSPEEGYVASRFRDSRDRAGNLNFLSWSERQGELRSLPIVDVESGATISLGEAWGLAT